MDILFLTVFCSILIFSDNLTLTHFRSVQNGKRKETSELKVDKDISFAHARREYQKTHETPNIRPYATVVRSQNETPSQADEMGLRERVQKLEERMEEALTMLNKIMEQTAPNTSTPRTHSKDRGPHQRAC